MNSVSPTVELVASAASAAREGICQPPVPLALHHGGRLARWQVGWRLTGEAGQPTIAALGGISAHRRVFDPDRRAAWWNTVVGPGQALDSDRVRILGMDYLGGCGQSSGPAGAETFPSVSSYDQAEALCALLDGLGIARLRAIVGASYGGMVALAFAERYPERVERIVVISAAARTSPMATAWRAIQRQIVRLGLVSGHPREAMVLARALAMTTYRSAEEFAARFGASPTHEGEHFVFPSEAYVLACGQQWAERHQPGSFLCLSESIDLHAINARAIRVPASLVAVREDRLVPIADMRALGAQLASCEWHELSSPFGHDAFLKEGEALRPVLAPLGAP